MAKIDTLHDALVEDDAAAIEHATSNYTACAEAPLPAPSADARCTAAIANELGSKKGFVTTPPDHAAATTAALVVLRDGRGDRFADVDTWLADIKNGRGVGHDVLRLAIARQMAASAAVVGKKIDDEASQKSILRAVTAAIPGACPTYWLLASGAQPLPPALDPDHSACVQKDLLRREGPGGAYGTGLARATEGALALWRETERALRLGLPNAEPGPKATLRKKLAIIEDATAKIATPRVAAEPDNPLLARMREVHAEAGVALTRPSDAGPGDAGRGARAP
jgi:hypothetical protein